MALLVFNLLGVGSVYALQRFQNTLPGKPQHFSNISSDTAFNTAVSFATNTNW
jgi:K+-transporting ATPase ATPase A chain